MKVTHVGDEVFGDPGEALRTIGWAVLQMSSAHRVLVAELARLRKENGELRVHAEAEYQHGYADGRVEAGEAS